MRYTSVNTLDNTFNHLPDKYKEEFLLAFKRNLIHLVTERLSKPLLDGIKEEGNSTHPPYNKQYKIDILVCQSDAILPHLTKLIDFARRTSEKGDTRLETIVNDLCIALDNG